MNRWAFAFSYLVLQWITLALMSTAIGEQAEGLMWLVFWTSVALDLVIGSARMDYIHRNRWWAVLMPIPFCWLLLLVMGEPTGEQEYFPNA